ncbi:MAG: arylesterase [Rhodocyclaceae bacterium]|nr:arylesterase [Rhodocyclaceae bacterium]MDP2196461.1 arylesterase [Rhodocyclaceae bacterium]
MIRSSILLFLLLLGMRSVFAADTVLVFGDSLSAGYGIAVQQSWPALLAERLRQQKPPRDLVNASISGETTAGGRSRLPAVLERHRPAVVILALGANDGLRGLPLAETRANLTQMVRAAKTSGARVLLVGMRLPPNYGPEYTRDFSALFATLARQEKTALLPFLLEPIALDDAAFQADRLHPTAAAQPKILDHVWKSLQPVFHDKNV